MALQKARINTEILQAAIVDGINAYIREILLGQGMVDEQRFDSWTGPDLEELKHVIAHRIAASWDTCEIDQ